MTKYTVASSQRGVKPEPRQVSPVWRGIGCLMMLIIPIVSFLIARPLVNGAVEQGYPLPYELIGSPTMPAGIYQTGLAPVAGFIASQDNLYAILVLTLLLILVIGGIISVVYAVIYRVVGPPRYGPLDVETPRVSTKRYKR